MRVCERMRRHVNSNVNVIHFIYYISFVHSCSWVDRGEEATLSLCRQSHFRAHSYVVTKPENTSEIYEWKLSSSLLLQLYRRCHCKHFSFAIFPFKSSTDYFVLRLSLHVHGSKFSGSLAAQTLAHIPYPDKKRT